MASGAGFVSIEASVVLPASRRSSYCNLAETLIGSFCSPPSLTVALLSSVTARTTSLPPASNSMVTRVSVFGSDARRKVDGIRR